MIGILEIIGAKVTFHLNMDILVAKSVFSRETIVSQFPNEMFYFGESVKTPNPVEIQVFVNFC